MNDSKIPSILKQHASWCVWKYEEGCGKVPYNPSTGHKAKSNDRSTFTDFDTAFGAYQTGAYAGLGIGIFDGVGAIDIDHCITDGKYSDMASDIIENMGSYTEISPIGSGIRIIFTVKNFEYNKDQYYINNQKKGLEVYISGATSKFVTVTGNAINSSPVADGTEKLREVLNQYMIRNGTRQSFQTDKEYLKIGLEKDEKLKSYWKGARPHGNESEDDAGFMAKLLYWLNNDSDAAISAFRSSPYAVQKDEKHQAKLARADYLSNLARAVKPDRTAAQDNEQWLKREAGHSQNAEPKGKRSLNIISAPDLQKANLPPTRYLVDGILPEGTSILAAAPKSGKSWFVLLIGLKVAAGEAFLKWQTQQAGVLYLSFEDTLKRLQQRMNKLLNGVPAPPWFYFSTDIVTLEEGLLELLDEHIQQHPETKLIIIDTFQKIRGQGLRGERWYDHDYREAGMIKEAMDKKGISVLFVHHTSKTKDKDDPFNEITGTNGISGVMDTMFVIKRTARNAQQATLHITGRDIEQNEILIRLNENTCQWEYVGNADELAKEEAIFDYQSSPVVKTIRALLEESPKNSWSGFAKNLLDAGERKFHLPIAQSPQQLGKELSRLKDLLLEQDNIVYTISPNGNAGHKHNFYRSAPPPATDELPDYHGF